MKQTIVAITMLSLLGASAAANADEDAIKRAQFMLRQVNQQKVQLESENASLKEELKKLKADKAVAEKNSAAESRKLGSSVSALRDAVAELKDRLRDELVTSHELRQQLNTRDNTLAQTQGRLTSCVADNGKLVELNRQVVNQYRDKGFWDVVAQDEPVTGIGGVSIENIVQQYETAIDDHDIDDSMVLPSASQSAVSGDGA
jgi:DNA repair exonuclease SbcCD ATPase subunit